MKIKVIVNTGIVEAILVDQNSPVEVEVIDLDSDYKDIEPLRKYVDQLYADPMLKPCDYATVSFEEDD
ncbi:MAG: hypothetical protein IKC03_04295 [Oscillospiraceae bacterium]|nr:hypothetical protein [Oscillospiraceae bacterium]